MLHWAIFSKLQSIKVNCCSDHLQSKGLYPFTVDRNSPLCQLSTVDIDFYYTESTLFQYTVNTGYNILVYKILRNISIKNENMIIFMPVFYII